MGRFELQTNPLHITVVLSARNAYALLSKLELPGSARTIGIADCFINGEHAPIVCLLRIEPDDEHYGRRGYGPGAMHPATEAVIARHGGMPPEPDQPIIGLRLDEPNEPAERSVDVDGSNNGSKDSHE